MVKANRRKPIDRRCCTLKGCMFLGDSFIIYFGNPKTSSDDCKKVLKYPLLIIYYCKCLILND